MSVLRFLGNLILAIILIVLIVLIFFAAYAVVVSKVWENVGLDQEVEGGSWTWIEGQPIYYRVWGAEQGPTVVLVHGFSVEGLQTWEANAPGLGRAGMRVIAVDLKGFGRSARDTSATYSLRAQADILAQVLNQLKVSQATLVGHGWGGAVALQLATDQPQFAAQLVLIAPQVYEEIVPLWQYVAKVRYVGPYLKRAAVWATDGGGPVWTLMRRRGFYRPLNVSNAYFREMVKPSHVLGTTDALLAMADSPQDSDLPQAISDIETPVLILMGSNDLDVPLASAERLQKQLPDAELVIIPEAGHYVHIEQSALVNEHIADFCLHGVR